MANQEHVDLLKKGGTAWNIWRKQHPEIRPDLSGADLNDAELNSTNLSRTDLSRAKLIRADLNFAYLREASLREAKLHRADLNFAYLGEANLDSSDLDSADLNGANLSKATLRKANLIRANLSEANLSEANLSEANLSRVDLYKATLRKATLYKAFLGEANLWEAHLNEADLREANLWGVNLSEANLSGADLSGASLVRAILVGTNLANTTLKECSIYGLSVWDVRLDGAKQFDLMITPHDQPTIMIDDLEVAQFIYLLLNNPKIRKVVDTVAQKAVLILGRFTASRKPILEAIRTALRSKGYVPILFDFEKPSSQDLTETVSTLAHLSRFIIADLTEPSCIPHELAIIIPNHVVPIVPLFHPTDSTRHEYLMFRDLRKRHRDWVLPIHHYTTLEDLLATLQTQIIEPAEKRAQELVIFKNTPEIEFL